MKLLITTLLLFSMSAFAKVVKPKTISDFKKTSVMIMDKNFSSGGSGSILKSSKDGSIILTNKHVCRIIEQGGYVLEDTTKFKITLYKKYPNHDLCLVKINENLGVSLVLSERLLEPSTLLYISGHPRLMPHLVKAGHSSNYLDIKLVVGLRECDDDDYASEKAMECFFYGGIPVVDTFSSVFTSVLIQPGSSGSAVFNKYGELIGVAFAGSGRGLSHAFIVPHIHLHYFLATEFMYNYVKVGTEVSDGNMSLRFFNEKCETSSQCGKYNTNMIGYR